MGHRKKTKRKKVLETPDRPQTIQGATVSNTCLEIVVKGDGTGPLEAVCSGVEALDVTGVTIRIIRRGVGDVNKTDVLHTETGSRLIVGFNVGVLPRVDEVFRTHGVEVRLYQVIYRLVEDVKLIAASMQPLEETGEEVIGTARVIALFKCKRHGIILGSEVLNGKLQMGAQFHLISGMGPIYTGLIESLHIEQESVKQATTGQQVGLKIKNFNRANIGDLIECFRKDRKKSRTPWKPEGKIMHL